MFTDEPRYDVWNEIRQQGMRKFAACLTPAVLLEAARRTRVKVVKSPLCLAHLVWLGIAAALHGTESFAGILTMTLRLMEDQEHFQVRMARMKRQAEANGKPQKRRKKHDPRRTDPTQVTEEAFAKARQRMPLEFWGNLIIALGEQFAVRHRPLHQFHGFRILAMDGTRIDLPNWKTLKDYFGTAKNHSGAHNAQARMVMLQFPFTRLPYRYELTPVAQGEVTVALRLAAHLQENDLVLLDAGYWSYHLLCTIADRGAFFAIRMYRRLNTRKLRNLQKDGRDRLVRWTPKDSRRRWRKAGLPKSVDLRVISYHVPGFRPQQMATNVLDPRKISRDDWTRLTTDCPDASRKLLSGLYHRRWEIETTYRELKVVQGMEGHLRSRTVESIQFEVAGHVVLYLLVRWLMVESAVRHHLDPLRISFVEALRELHAMRESLVAAAPRWAEVLVSRLLERISQHLVPSRPGRHYPRRKKKATRKSRQPKKTPSKITKTPRRKDTAKAKRRKTVTSKG